MHARQDNLKISQQLLVERYLLLHYESTATIVLPCSLQP